MKLLIVDEGVVVGEIDDIEEYDFLFPIASGEVCRQIARIISQHEERKIKCQENRKR